jgi:hypothetical protein
MALRSVAAKQEDKRFVKHRNAARNAAQQLKERKKFLRKQDSVTSTEHAELDLLHLTPRVRQDVQQVIKVVHEQRLNCAHVDGSTATVVRPHPTPTSFTSTLTPGSCYDGIALAGSPSRGATTWYQCACTCKKKPQVRLISQVSHRLLSATSP